MILVVMFDLFKDTFDAWNKDHAPRLGAALAYYTVFSLCPLLIIVIAIAGFVFGQAAARQQILAQMQSLVGPQGVQFIETAIINSNRPSANIVFSVIGLVTLLLGALGVFGQLQDALNAIWGVAPKPGRGWEGLIRDRLLSFTMVLGAGFLLLVSLVINTGIAALVRYFGEFLPISAAVLQGINFFVTLLVITIVFALIFKYLPDAQIAWKNVWVGALMTSLFFVIGKSVLGFYLGISQIGTAYGAAGSLLVVLVWIYYSAQILFFGAEFTKIFATRYGKGIVPAPNAVRVIEEAQA